MDLSALSAVLAEDFREEDFGLAGREELAGLLEALCQSIRAQEQEHQNQIDTLRQRQVEETKPILDHFEEKNVQLIDKLVQTREEERQLRAQFDSLSHKTQQAKKTVAVTQNLSLAISRVTEEKDNLEQLRERRSTTWKNLESIIALSTAAQKQMMTIGTISAELRRSVEHRDYQTILELVGSEVFSFSFGTPYQEQLLNTVNGFRSSRRLMRLRRDKMSQLASVRDEIRLRIARLISLNWK